MINNLANKNQIERIIKYRKRALELGHDVSTIKTYINSDGLVLFTIKLNNHIGRFTIDKTGASCPYKFGTDNYQEIDLINFIDSENAEITSVETVKLFNSEFLRIHYTISKEYQEQNELWCNTRLHDILLKPAKTYEGHIISDQSEVLNI